MFALAARELGYRIFIYSPDNDSPAGQIGDREFSHAYDDLDRIREFARLVQVVTFEFENVPAASTAAAAEIVPVRPDGGVLRVPRRAGGSGVGGLGWHLHAEGRLRVTQREAPWWREVRGQLT